MSDFKLAIRSLRKRPLFALVAILTMALGVGANAAIFSLVYQTLLRPLPVAPPARLGFVWSTSGTMLPLALLSRHDRHVLKSGFPAIHRLLEFTADPKWLDEI